MNKKQVQLFILIFSINVYGYGQSEKNRLNLLAVGGIAFRTTIMQSNNIQQSFNQTQFWNDYLHEKNIQGLSYQVGLKLKIPHPKLTFSYRFGIRYDHTHNLILRWTDDPDEKRAICPECGPNIINNGELAISEFQKSWLFDHHLTLVKPIKDGKHRVGIGLSLINFNEHYIDYYGVKKHIEFMNYDFIYQRRIYENIVAQVNVIFIPKGQYPPDRLQAFVSYSIGLFYELNVFK